MIACMDSKRHVADAINQPTNLYKIDSLCSQLGSNRLSNMSQSVVVGSRRGPAPMQHIINRYLGQGAVRAELPKCKTLQAGLRNVLQGTSRFAANAGRIQ